jgi:hypothetical protein
VSGPKKRSTAAEYNALRGLFLDENYRIAFIETVCPEWLSSLSLDDTEVRNNELPWAEDRLGQAREQLAQRRRAEAAKYSIRRWIESSRVKREIEELEQNIAQCQRNINELFAEFERFKKSMRVKCDCGRPKFGVGGGVDVQINCNFRIECDFSPNASAHWKPGRHESKAFRIHVEPAVSDNYPDIARKMRARGAQYLFLGAYEGQGSTSTDFEKIFNSADITVVYRAAVDATLAAISSIDTNGPSDDSDAFVQPALSGQHQESEPRIAWDIGGDGERPIDAGERDERQSEREQRRA